MRTKLMLIILILTCSRLVFAQAPQGLNYQAVAYDAGGLPVVNQNVSVRLSILDVSATGAIIYQETQGPTTDNTGLFAIVVGNGTVVSGTFSNINWGNGAKFLKTEIDITGGANYVAMGTSQFMSVPYALYANSAASSPGFENPDGFNNIIPLQLNDTIPFTVPAGKNLYANYDYVKVDTLGFGVTIQSGGMYSRPFIGASAGSQVRSAGTGFLVDATVEWKSFDIACNPFIVPAGKIFVIVSVDWSAPLYGVINGKVLRRNMCRQFLKAGDVLTVDVPCTGNEWFYINGYLRDN